MSVWANAQHPARLATDTNAVSISTANTATKQLHSRCPSCQSYLHSLAWPLNCRHSWDIAWLVLAWSVDWSCALGGLAVSVVSRSWVEHWRGYSGKSDWDSTRYQTNCSSGLRFSCLAWKHCDGSRLPHLARAWWGWVAALLMWLVCCWVGPLAGWFLVEAVKSFGEPHSIESSHVGGGSCALCYSRHDFQCPV